MPSTRTRPFDPAEALDTPEAQAEYLSIFLGDGDLGKVGEALGVIARARGMTGVAKGTGLAREALYRALGPEGNPEFGTVLKVMDALGLKLAASPAR